LQAYFRRPVPDFSLARACVKELVLKMSPLPRKGRRGDSFVTSHTEAREGLDVHAVEFSKTALAGG
jgi:hypothetical protein